jgi:ribosomal protein S13
LSDDQIAKLLKLIESSDLIITSDLKKLKQLVTKRLVVIKSYRGLRRINGFTVEVNVPILMQKLLNGTDAKINFKSFL